MGIEDGRWRKKNSLLSSRDQCVRVVHALMQAVVKLYNWGPESVRGLGAPATRLRDLLPELNYRTR